MEKNMETTIVYWGYMGIMEKKMQAYLALHPGEAPPLRVLNGAMPLATELFGAEESHRTEWSAAARSHFRL